LTLKKKLDPELVLDPYWKPHGFGTVVRTNPW